MNLAQLRSMKPQILSIAHAHGVGNMRVFGWVARGEAVKKTRILITH